MEHTNPREQDKYIVRFERPGHRAELKALAAAEKRSLNKQILMLIEAGQRSLRPPFATTGFSAATLQAQREERDSIAKASMLKQWAEKP